MPKRSRRKDWPLPRTKERPSAPPAPRPADSTRPIARKHDFLWSAPSDRWLSMCHQLANKTETSELTYALLQHRRCWSDQHERAPEETSVSPERPKRRRGNRKVQDTHQPQGSNPGRTTLADRDDRRGT